MKKLLIAVDRRDIWDLILRQAEELGYCGIGCGTGMRALQVLEDNPDVSLLIVDAVLPELSGEELIGLLRQRPRFRKLPIILLRSDDDLTTSDQFNRGPTHFLDSPLNEDELRTYLGQYAPHTAFSASFPQ